jgi:sec-independent protein translocase protein TatA
LPEAGRAVGKGMREFKDSLSGINDHDDDEDDGEPATIRDGTTATKS